MEWELSWTAGSTAKDTSQPHVLLAVCHLSSHLTSLNVLSKLYIRISYSIALGVKWGGYKGLSTASSMEVLALSSSLLFLFPLPQKLIYWDEKWRIWLGQKKKKQQHKVSLMWQATKHMARTWTLGKVARIQTLALTITTSCAILGKLLILSVLCLLVCVIRRIRSMVWRLNESTFVKGLVPGT